MTSGNYFLPASPRHRLLDVGTGGDLRSSVRKALGLAARLSAAVVLMLLVVTGGVVLGLIPDGRPSLREVWLPIPLILAAYFAAAAAGGAAWSLTRRHRRRSVGGWMLSGIAITGAAGGVVPVAVFAFRTLLRIIASGPDSARGGWVVVAIFAAAWLLLGVLVGLWLWIMAWSRYDLPGQAE